MGSDGLAVGIEMGLDRSASEVSTAWRGGRTKNRFFRGSFDPSNFPR